MSGAEVEAAAQPKAREHCQDSLERCGILLDGLRQPRGPRLERLNMGVARALRLHRLALEALLPSMETHAKEHRAERERQQGKAAWRALGAAS